MITKRWVKVREAWFEFICRSYLWWTGYTVPMPAKYIPAVILPARVFRAVTNHPIVQYCWGANRFKSLT